MTTHTKPCKFCGIPVTVSSDPDCPPDWAESLLKMLACNRCADYRAAMGRIGAAIRKVCLNYIQLVNGKTITDDGRSKVRKGLEALTWKVADATCKFYRIKTLYDQDFVDQIMEHPDKSTLILKTYAGMVRDEARRQRQQHEKRVEPTTQPETVLFGGSGGQEDKSSQCLHEHAPGRMAVAGNGPGKPATDPDKDQRRGVSEQTVLI